MFVSVTFMAASEASRHRTQRERDEEMGSGTQSRLEEIRYHLLAQRMHYWLMVAHPIDKYKVPHMACLANFWHLCRKCPDLSQRLGRDELSVLSPIGTAHR